VHGTEQGLREFAPLSEVLAQKVGRLLINLISTGVEVLRYAPRWSPYPVTTDIRTRGRQWRLSKGLYVYPPNYQNFPEYLLPEALKTVILLLSGA